LHYRNQEGQWTRPLPDPACAFTISFGGQGSFYVRDCYFSYIHEQQESGRWFLHSKNKEMDLIGVYKGDRRALRLVKKVPKVLDFAADSRGNLWGIRMDGQVVRFNQKAKRWVKTGLDKGISITAGPKGHVYVLRDTAGSTGAFTIYSWSKRAWVAQAGKKAKSIAVGSRGRLFMTDGQDRIWISQSNPKKQSCPNSRRRGKKVPAKSTQSEDL